MQFKASVNYALRRYAIKYNLNHETAIYNYMNGIALMSCNFKKWRCFTLRNGDNLFAEH